MSSHRPTLRFHRGASALLAGVLCSAALGSALSACSSDSSDGDTKAPPFKVPVKLAIVADWLNRSLSYVDVATLATATTRDAAVTGTVSLPDDSPGPLEVALTPDRKTALVSISAGFFSIPLAGAIVNASNIPTDPGKLLFVDVATGKVTGELVTGMSPTGIAITPDGARAFVTDFGSSDMAIVDVAAKTVLDHVMLDVYPEEISFDQTGTVGVVGDSSAGSVHTFSVADPKGTLTAVPLKGDSGGVGFFPGTKVAFVVQAPNPLSTMSGFTIIDVTDPKVPVVLQDERLPEAPIGYPVAAAAARQSMLVPVTVASRLVLREYKLANNQAVLSQTIDIADGQLLSALGIAYDGDHTALLAWPAQKSLVVVDLDAKTSRVIPWLPDQAGPAGVVYR